MRDLIIAVVILIGTIMWLGRSCSSQFGSGALEPFQEYKTKTLTSQETSEGGNRHWHEEVSGKWENLDNGETGYAEIEGFGKGDYGGVGSYQAHGEVRNSAGNNKHSLHESYTMEDGSVEYSGELEYRGRSKKYSGNSMTHNEDF